MKNLEPKERANRFAFNEEVQWKGKQPYMLKLLHWNVIIGRRIFVGARWAHAFSEAMSKIPPTQPVCN